MKIVISETPIGERLPFALLITFIVFNAGREGYLPDLMDTHHVRSAFLVIPTEIVCFIFAFLVISQQLIAQTILDGDDVLRRLSFLGVPFPSRKFASKSDIELVEAISVRHDLHPDDVPSKSYEHELLLHRRGGEKIRAMFFKNHEESPAAMLAIFDQLTGLAGIEGRRTVT